MKAEDLKKAEDIDEVIRTLVVHAPPDVLRKATHDAILVDEVFPMIGESFKYTTVIPNEVIQQFKDQFDYRGHGISNVEEVKQKIQPMLNIDRIIDTIVRYMPEENQEQISIKHIKNVWFKQNSASDVNAFVDNLNKDFWKLQ